MELIQQYDTAVLREMEGDRDGAIELLRTILAESPNFALAHNALSAMYGRAEKIDQAIEHAKRYTELEPDDAFGYAILSALCVKAGRREEAEAALMNAQQSQMRAYMESRQKEEKEKEEEKIEEE